MTELRAPQARPFGFHYFLHLRRKFGHERLAVRIRGHEARSLGQMAGVHNGSRFMAVRPAYRPTLAAGPAVERRDLGSPAMLSLWVILETI